MSVSFPLRGWQSEFARKLAAHPGDDFLLVACPAAGKTIAAGAAVAGVMHARECDQLIVVCPTVVVRDQWASELNRLGYRMRTQLERGEWPASVHGVCATYAQVAQRAALYAAACVNRRTVVVFDEIHHAGLQLSWGAAVADAFPRARMRLMLSGTPFRSDRDRIPFVRYALDGMCQPDFAYDYPRAVREGVCRPIEFRAHDGVITWLDDGKPSTASFAQPLSAPARAQRLRASLDPARPYLAALLADAHNDLLALRERVPNAAGLVVCDTQAHALQVDALLTEITDSMPVLAISDMPGAHKAITAFAREDVQWLVSVRMVAEGVDIPRLGVIAWATTARTELMVRQVAGRALRGRGGHAALPAIVHMPADPQLIKYAHRIDVLGGVSLQHRNREPHSAEHAGRPGTGHAVALRAVDAQPTASPPRAIAPQLPTRQLRAAAEPVEISTPDLPPAPEDLLAAQQAREAARAELYHQLTLYAQLRRSVNPVYQLASAHAELAAAVGVRRHTDATDEQLAHARDWLRAQLAALAARYPKHVKELARTRRRLAA